MNRDSGAPLVSVIATCFNHERYVERCLASIRAQTYPQTEVIICDDASTDRSPELIREWVRREAMDCRLILHEKNVGLCATLNEALAAASGQFVAMIATDDLWLPEKTEVQVRQFHDVPRCVGVLYSDALLVNPEGTVLSGTFIEGLRAARSPRLCARFQRPPEGDIARVLLRGNFIPAMTTLVRKECFERVGPYDEDLVYEDFDMWLRIARHYEFRFTPGPLAYYRVVPTSLARTMGERGALSTLRVYQKWLADGRGQTGFVREQIARRAFGLSELVPEQRGTYVRLGLSHARRPRSLFRAAIALSRLQVTKRSADFRDPHRAGRT